MKYLGKSTMMASAVALTTSAAFAQEATGDIPPVTLFKNVMVFDGVSDGLKNVDVLVVKNKIHKIDADIPEGGKWEVDVRTGGSKRLPDPVGGIDGYSFTVQTERGIETKEVDVTVIDGGGRTLMPGLIDSHVHMNGYMDGNIITWQNTTWEEIGARAAAFAQEMLAMGFTTVRDMGGPAFGLARNNVRNIPNPLPIAGQLWFPAPYTSQLYFEGGDNLP